MVSNKFANNLSINPTNGDAYPTNSDGGTGTVTAIIHSGCGDITLPVKNVYVGSLPTPSIMGTVNVHCGYEISYRVDDINAVYGTTFLWSSDNLSIINSESPRCTAWGSFNGAADISCTVTACGVSKTGTKLLHVNMCDYLLFSPNPATEETTVSIESETQKNAIIASGWDMEVYDQSHLLKIKKTKLKDRITTLNISGWKDGVYIVRAHIGEEWISGKLVVKH